MSDIFKQIMFNLNQGYYNYIGSGSSREVFDLENGYVVKVAKNMAGIAQNQTEYAISYYDNSDLFAKVVQVSDNFYFLIMEKADKVDSISDVFKYFKVSGKKGLFHLKKLQNIKRKYNLVLGDFDRRSNWGIIKGRPVIIDYGFTREVSEIYY